MYQQIVLKLPGIKHRRIRPLVLKLLRGEVQKKWKEPSELVLCRDADTPKTHYVIKNNTNTRNICLSAAWEAGLVLIDNKHFICSAYKILVFSAGVVDPTERLSPADCRLEHV